MVFQFEHMDVDADADNKWTDKKMDLREMKAVLTKWQKGLEDIAWNSLFWDNHDLPRIVSRWGNGQGVQSESARCLLYCCTACRVHHTSIRARSWGMTNVQYDIEDYKDCEIINMYHERLEKDTQRMKS